MFSEVAVGTCKAFRTINRSSLSVWASGKPLQFLFPKTAALSHPTLIFFWHFSHRCFRSSKVFGYYGIIRISSFWKSYSFLFFLRKIRCWPDPKNTVDAEENKLCLQSFLLILETVPPVYNLECRNFSNTNIRNSLFVDIFKILKLV